eukprot:jgi/Tetstr1/430887/TSEL_020644.t1
MVVVISRQAMSSWGRASLSPAGAAGPRWAPSTRPRRSASHHRRGPGAPLTVMSASGNVHVVKEGETLSEIAVRYGVSMRELREANTETLGIGKKDIKNADGRVLRGSDIIYVGQKLDVPQTPTSQTVASVPAQSDAIPPAGTPWSTIGLGAGALLLLVGVGRLVQQKLGGPAEREAPANEIGALGNVIDRAKTVEGLASTGEGAQPEGKAPQAADGAEQEQEQEQAKVDGLKDAVEEAGYATDTVLGADGDAVENLKGAGEEAVENAKAVASEAVEGLKEGGKDAGEATAEAAEGLKEAGEEVAEGALEAAKEAQEETAEAAAEEADSVKEAATVAVEDATEEVEDVKEEAKEKSSGGLAAALSGSLSSAREALSNVPFRRKTDPEKEGAAEKVEGVTAEADKEAEAAGTAKDEEAAEVGKEAAVAEMAMGTVEMTEDSAKVRATEDDAVAAYVAGEGTEREGSEEAELPPGPDPALVASNGAVPPEVVAAVTAAEREQAGLPKDPEPAVRGETCSITPEDAVWAAALASTAVEVDESSEAVSTNLVKLDQMRVGKEAELSMEDMLWAADLTRRSDSTDSHIVEVAALRATAKAASRELEAVLWSAAAAAASTEAASPEARKELEQKVTRARERMLGAIQAIEVTIMRAGGRAVAEAASVDEDVVPAEGAPAAVQSLAGELEGAGAGLLLLAAERAAKAGEEVTEAVEEAAREVVTGAVEAANAAEEAVKAGSDMVQEAVGEGAKVAVDVAEGAQQGVAAAATAAYAQVEEAAGQSRLSVSYEELVKGAAGQPKTVRREEKEEAEPAPPPPPPAQEEVVAAAPKLTSSHEELVKMSVGSPIAVERPASELPVAERQQKLQEKLDHLVKALETPKYLPAQTREPLSLPAGKRLTGSAFIQAHTWAAQARHQVKLNVSSIDDAEPEGPVEAPPAPRRMLSGSGSGNGSGARPRKRTEQSTFATKISLLDAVYAVGRGLDAPMEVRGAVEELLSMLETANPLAGAAPSEAMRLLDGRWKLVYTTNAQALAVLSAFRRMPLVNVGDITQIVDGAALTVENKVEVAVPFMLSLSALAGFEVRTPRQLKVQFNKGKVDTRITTPQLFADLEVPSEVSVLGQTVDLRPVQRLMTPVNSALKSASRTVASVVAPELEFEVPTYLLITYLDDNLRVSRDAGGGVYVMVKDIAIE